MNRLKESVTWAGAAALVMQIPDFAEWVPPVKSVLAGAFGLAAIIMREAGNKA